MQRRTALTLVACAILLGSLPLRAGRAVFPGKPIRLLVGLAAGGATDVMARLVAQKMSENLRTTVFVENKAGGIFVPALRELTGFPTRRPHPVLHLDQRADHPAAASRTIRSISPNSRPSPRSRPDR